jgi:beta-lactamase regulating signal transducer with metallopeptidase domain/peroxiredoxin
MSDFTNWCAFFVLNSAWQLVVLTTVTEGLVHALPRAANGLQYRLWVGCLLLAVTLPVISTYLALTPFHSSMSVAQANDPDRWKIPRPSEQGRLTLHLTEVPPTLSRWNAPPIIAGLYLIYFFAGVGKLLLRLNRTSRIVARRIPLASEAAALPVLQARLKASKRIVDVFASSDLHGPATVTWPQPMILLPKAFDRMAGAEKAVVMAHELAHVQRRDFEANLLLEAISSVISYHPATSWLKRRIAECREAICDEMAAEVTFGRTTYAHTLLNVAEKTASQASLREGLTLGIADSELERRIMKLVQAPVAMSHRRKSLLHALCLLVLAFCSIAVLRFSLHPSSVQAAGMPAFPFDPSQTFDTLTPKAQRKQAPDFTLVDNNGKTIGLSNYKGKVVLLDFWATWCGGCKVEIPWYIEFDRKYRKDGLAVIGVSMDEKGWGTVRPFLAKKKDDETGGIIVMQYPIVIGNNALGTRFGLTSMPMTLLIDKDGKIAVSHVGVVDKENFESNIQRLLKQ